MTVQFYPNGIGGTAPGDSLDLARPLQTTGNVWYVSSLIGTDAAAPAGQNREKPLATISQAQTNASSGDIVVFLAGHTQTLTGATVIGKNLTFIGEGMTSGKPAVSFLINSAATNLFTLAGIIELRNIYFPNAVQTNTRAKVEVANDDCRIRGCYFECGATDTGQAIYLSGGNRARIDDTTIISTAVLRSAQPLVGIKNDVVAITGLEINNCTVSAGTVGFSNYAAVDLSVSAVTNVRVEGLSLLLGADMAMSTSTTGRVNVQLSTGGSRVSWS